MDLWAEFDLQWEWLWVPMEWWVYYKFFGFKFCWRIWVLLLWIWLSFVANGGCGLRYGGAVVGLLGFFGFGFCCWGGGCGWLRWWLWRMTMIGHRRRLLLAHVRLWEEEEHWLGTWERERQILRRERENQIKKWEEREKLDKIVFFSLPFVSVQLQICNSTDTNGKNLAHIKHPMGGVFCVWCGKCAKYLTFGTFATSAMGALIGLRYYPFLLLKISSYWKILAYQPIN